MIPASTQYKLVSKAGIVIAEGSKGAMLKARKATQGSAIWLSPASQIGDNLAERFPASFEAAQNLTPKGV